MFKFFAKIIVAVIANGLGLLAAAQFVQGFHLADDLREVTLIALILTALNFFIKPILKFILGPLIILTFGAGLIAVNAFVLYLLDITTAGLMIEGILALVFASLIIGALNILFHFATK